MPCTKKRYSTRKLAHRAARRYRKSGGELSKPYRCRDDCCEGLWHLTLKERQRRLGYDV